MSIQTKICGIRSLEGLTACIEAGADFVGFNFVGDSKRYIDPQRAKSLIRNKRGDIQTVGVFQYMTHREVNQIAEFLHLDFIQLHGSENSNYIHSMIKPVIKSFSLTDDAPIDQMIKYLETLSAAHILIDQEKIQDSMSIDTSKASLIAKKCSLFLAGSLTPTNVARKIQAVHPYAVDVARGIETDGKEDVEKIYQFVKNAKGAIL